MECSSIAKIDEYFPNYTKGTPISESPLFYIYI